MHTFNAIIFDLGGVLLNIDFKKVHDAFVKLDVLNFDELYSQSHVTALFENLETGKISENEFCEGIKVYSDKDLSNEDIIHAWNALLLDFRKESLDYLKQLKLRYRLFLLSNTNSIHFNAFTATFHQTIGQEQFESYFEKAYYSHVIGLRKPDADAYRFVLNENNLEAETTLFIDDTPANIEGAKAVGLQTILLQKGMTIERLDL